MNAAPTNNAATVQSGGGRSIDDLTAGELSTLVRQAARAKHAIKAGNIPQGLQGTLTGKTVALMFSKRSTRTRVSTEAAVVAMGGHPMFLGKDDIQLGVGSHPPPADTVYWGLCGWLGQ